jgi:hypothetical protein
MLGEQYVSPSNRSIAVAVTLGIVRLCSVAAGGDTLINLDRTLPDVRRLKDGCP